MIAIKMVIVGHQKQLQFLQAAREGGRLGHAFIFSGPDETGKKTAALEWLSGILGVPLSAGTAHPDFLFVAPLFDEKTNPPAGEARRKGGKTAGEITVGQVREMIRRLSLRPSTGRYKAAVIDEAQLMNSEAQNALLKTLEEPPGEALIVLIARNSRQLLETIRSRCQTMQFGLAGAKELEIMAKELVLKNGNKSSEDVLKEAVELSFGRPGRLVKFIADPSLIEKRRADAKEFARIAKSDLAEKFIYAAKVAESENAVETIEIWQYHFRNLLLHSLSKPSENAGGDSTWVGPTQSAQGMLRGSNPRKEVAAQFAFSKLKGGENGLPTEKISAILKKIHALSVTLQTTNASPKLAIENFMLEL